MRMKKILFLLLALVGCSAFTYAEDTSFISAQVAQINQVLKDNSTGPNDPKASFKVDTTEKTLTLNFARNKSLAGMDRNVFELIAQTLPLTILTTVYITSKGIVNGQIVGGKFIKELQDNNYMIIVIISGTDKKYEFSYPSSVLTLGEN